MESTTVGDHKRRPGGRTADVTERVREAVLELIVEGGYAACTFSSVAARAGVERSTLYRRFPDRWATIIDAFMARSALEIMPDTTGSFAGDLKSVLRKLAATLDGPLGPALMAAAAELRARQEADYPRAYFDQRVAQLKPMFDAAVERGELAADVERETLFSFAAGPIYFRMFIAGRAVDLAFIDTVVESVCWLYCGSGATERG
ncbi:MAG: TetR/AcrR family transcriptional regulator [Sphingomicrobium sp.]